MRDPEHLTYLRGLQCAVGTHLGDEASCCFGAVQAHHHTGGRGRGQKSSDHRAFPLCLKHHTEFHSASGTFKTWKKEERRKWQDEMVERYKPVDGVF